MKTTRHLLLIFISLLNLNLFSQGNYQNFKVSIYTRAFDVKQMEDPHWLDSTWRIISSQLKVDKIYLETHRDMFTVDKKALQNAIQFFKKQGIEVAGGITYTINEGNQFETFCYTQPEIRKKAQELIEYTASYFDEIILDDFFFTSCKCKKCIEAKGDKTWAEYRLNLMTDAAENLIVKPAKAINPKVKIIIKYPNWYDHFQELGFNLETEPKIFDGLYTGTETRDAVLSDQHLQPYLGYLIFRYFNNLKPGKNGGGWVDTGGMQFFDRYAEQLWITILAKAPEITLFDYGQMLYPLKDFWVPGWKNEQVSFDYDHFLPLKPNETMAKTVSHSLKTIDKIAGQLGTPYGIKSYKPFHSDGEYFLQNYLGMIGIPMDLVSEFPFDDDLILLTEQAKKDEKIVEKIEKRLLNGKDVIITSGLLNALQDRGIQKIVNLKYTNRKAIVSDFMLNRRIVKGETPVTIPQIEYFTNDSWEIISGMDGGLGWPILHQGKYADARLYVLTIPENFADLYNLPEEVLNQIRGLFCKPFKMTLMGPSKVSLFLYDNNTFVVESFNDKPVEIKMVLNDKVNSITNIESAKIIEMEVIPEIKFWGHVFAPEKYSYTIKLPTHSLKTFKINR
jgi:hypothetical protein